MFEGETPEIGCPNTPPPSYNGSYLIKWYKGIINTTEGLQPDSLVIWDRNVQMRKPKDGYGINNVTGALMVNEVNLTQNTFTCAVIPLKNKTSYFHTVLTVYGMYYDRV